MTKAEVDKLAADVADAAHALETAPANAVIASTGGAVAASGGGETSVEGSEAEVAGLRAELEEALATAAAATEIAEGEAAARAKVAAELKDSAQRESELRMLAENAIAAATRQVGRFQSPYPTSIPPTQLDSEAANGGVKLHDDRPVTMVACVRVQICI